MSGMDKEDWMGAFGVDDEREYDYEYGLIDENGDVQEWKVAPTFSKAAEALAGCDGQVRIRARRQPPCGML